MGNGVNGLVKWDSLTKRLAGMAERECKERGFAIMQVYVLVDANGEPAFYTEPELTKIEPRIGPAAFLEQVLRMMARSKQLAE